MLYASRHHLESNFTVELVGQALISPLSRFATFPERVLGPITFHKQYGGMGNRSNDGLNIFGNPIGSLHLHHQAWLVQIVRESAQSTPFLRFVEFSPSPWSI